MVGLTLWAALPRLYRSEASLLVQAPEVTSNYVQPTIAALNVEDRLQAAIQQVLQRPRLVEIARRFDLYPRLAGQGEERIVEQMRRHIAVELGEEPGLSEEYHRGQPDMVCFKLSFVHTDPRKTQKVAARLAALLIEEGQRARVEHARQTTHFLARELERLRTELAAREAAIREYKEAHLGELPEQLEANLSALSRLQAALQTNQSALSAAEARQAALHQAAAEFAQAQMVRNTGSVIPPPTLFAGPPEARLAALKQSLPALEARYTANHPNVTKTRNEIARLEAELTRARPKGTPSSAPAAGQDLGSQLAATAAEIGRLRGEQAGMQRRIAFYQARVEATPQREQEFAALSREYECARANYEALLKRRAEAEMAEKLENKEPGAQFRIIDAANLPERPFKPSLPRILAVALFLGLTGGAALAFGRESADRTFRSVDDLEAYLDLNVLAAVPLVKSPEQLAADRRRRRLIAAATLAAALLWAGLIAYVRSGLQAT